MNCEGMNACRRGAKASIAAVNELKETLPEYFCMPINDSALPTVMGVDLVDDTAVSVDSADDSDQSPDDETDGLSNGEINDVADESNTKTDADRDAKAAVKLLHLKYDACVACLPCLTTRKLGDANFTCVNGECPHCGFDKIWSKGLRRQILMREYDSEKREWVDKLNPNSALATNTWLKQVEWRSYVTKETPSVAAHLQEVNRQAAAAARPAEADDGDYTPANENKSARNLVLEKIVER